MTKSLLLLFSVILLLSGCASQYTITEKQLNNYLNNKVHFEIKQGNQFLGAEMKINDIDVTLGDKPNTMAIAANSTIKIFNPLIPLNTTLTTKFEAKPWYDANQHSVYLRQLRLVEIKSDPEGIEKSIQPITHQVMQFLTHTLETQPVYILDTKDSKQALVAKMTKSIKVTQGKLKLIFDE